MSETWLERENRLWLCINSEGITVEERKRIERDYFNEVCDRIIANPRFYLDHLDELDEFRVSWVSHYLRL